MKVLAYSIGMSGENGEGISAYCPAYGHSITAKVPQTPDRDPIISINDFPDGNSVILVEMEVLPEKQTKLDAEDAGGSEEADWWNFPTNSTFIKLLGSGTINEETFAFVPKQ